MARLGEGGRGEGERSDITTCAIAYVVLLLHRPT